MYVDIDSRRLGSHRHHLPSKLRNDPNVNVMGLRYPPGGKTQFLRNIKLRLLTTFKFGVFTALTIAYRGLSL